MDEQLKIVEINIRIDIRQPLYGNGQISLQHNFSIRADSFDDISRVMKKYDELSREIETLNAIPKQKR